MKNGAMSIILLGQTAFICFSLWCRSETTSAVKHFSSKWNISINESIARILNI